MCECESVCVCATARSTCCRRPIAVGVSRDVEGQSVTKKRFWGCARNKLQTNIAHTTQMLHIKEGLPVTKKYFRVCVCVCVFVFV